jgi:hypothetical protein
MTKAKRASVLPSTQTEIPEWLWTDDEFSNRYPALHEFLACGTWEGKVRKGGSINLFVGQGRLKVCFLDKQTQMAFYQILEAKNDLLSELEGYLAGVHDPWQPVKAVNGKPVF